jgi:14-3-3 protein epsilon
MTVTECMFLARIAEQAEIFQDMKEFCMPILYGKGSDLTVEERDLLSVAFRGLISPKRTAIKIIYDLEWNP